MRFPTPAFLFALAAVSAMIGLVGAVSSPASAALGAGAPPTNSVALQPSSGDSATIWKLVLNGEDDFCPGDGIAGYRWSTFIVPSSIDIAVTTWDGPIPGAPNVANGFPLTDDAGTFIVNQFPGNDDGFVNPPLEMTFNSALGTVLSAGEWQIGIACTLQDGNGIQRTEKYWAGAVTLADSSGAGPHDFTYAVEATASTTTTTTVAQSGSTTTTAAGASSTTTSTTTESGGSSTTTSTTADGGSSTTTTAASVSGTATTVVGSGGVASGGPVGGPAGGSGRLAATGSSSMWFVASAILLLIAGRMVLLSGRPITVLAPIDPERIR